MGSDVTKGMDELDLLILEAYPQAKRAHMDKYRALAQEVGLENLFCAEEDRRG